jgi:regulator of protease activity HflC (stomatin/prohibitin superfamily)
MRVRLVSLVVFLMLAAVVALVGYGVGALFDAPGKGALYALLTLLPVAAFVQKQAWSRLALALLGLCFVFANELGGLWAGVLVYLAGLLMVSVSSASLGGLYGGSAAKSLWQHLKIMLHIDEGFYVVDNGATWGTHEGQDEPFLGPRAIIVRPGSAATLVNGGVRTRVVGPSMFTSERWEHVKHSYNLQPLRRDLALRDVLTRDLLPLEVKLSITFGIDIPAAMRTGAEPLSVEARDRLASIDDDIPEWDRQAEAIIEGELREAMASIRLRRVSSEMETIMAGSAEDARAQGPELLDIGRLRFENIEHGVESNANRRLKPLGVVLHRVTLKSIQPQAEVIAANNQAAIEAIRERGRAEAWAQALGMLADGYKIARDSGLSNHDLHAEVLRRMLEMLARDPSSGLFLPSETMRALAELRRTVD